MGEEGRERGGKGEGGRGRVEGRSTWAVRISGGTTRAEVEDDGEEEEEVLMWRLWVLWL